MASGLLDINHVSEDTSPVFSYRTNSFPRKNSRLLPIGTNAALWNHRRIKISVGRCQNNFRAVVHRFEAKVGVVS
jgi:hypothetical protein